MKCAKCTGPTEVLVTYQNADNSTRRRRKCMECGIRFTTREHLEPGSVTERKEEGGIDKESHPWYNVRLTPTTIEDKP